MQKVRYAPPDPTLPKPWRGLVDVATGNLYFWNQETKVTTYVRPTADPQPQPDIDNHSGGVDGDVDRSHQSQGAADVGGRGDDIKNGDQCNQSQGATTDTSSQLTGMQSVLASEAHGEDLGHKQETNVVSQGATGVTSSQLTAQQSVSASEAHGGDYEDKHETTDVAKRKEISKSYMSKKTISKKQKTTVDTAEGQVEVPIVKPEIEGKEKMIDADVPHLVEEEQQESDEVNKPDQDQLAKETSKISDVEGEVPQSASITGAVGVQVNRSETFAMNVVSPICTPVVAKETGTSLPEEVPIVGTDLNQELLSLADGPKGLDEEMIDGGGLTDQDGRISTSNDDATRIEANLDKQPINPSSDKVEEDLALSIDRLAGVVEAIHNVIRYTISSRETIAQLRRENEELKKKVADLEANGEGDRARLKGTIVGNQLARCQFLGSKFAS